MRQCLGRGSTCASTTLIHNPSSARHLVSRSPTTSRGCMFDAKKASILMQEIDMDEQHPSLPRQLSLLWFSRDLRVGDNAALQAASASPASGPSYLVPVYILSPRDHLQPRRSLHDGGTGVPKLGPHRAHFLVECLSALRQELRQQYSSDLIYRCGEPHIELSLLVRQILQSSPQIQHVALYHHMDHPTETLETETKTRDVLRNTAKALGITLSVHTFWGLTLYHPDDLPYCAFNQNITSLPVGAKRSGDGIVSASRFSGLPGVMTDFRKAVQSLSEVRPCIPAPTSLPPLPPAFTSLPLPLSPTESFSPSNPPATVSQHSQATSSDVSAASLQAETGISSDTGTGSDLCRIDRGDLPVSISDMYVAAGAGEQLQRLQQLTRQDFTLLPAPNSGGVDQRSAFKLVGGEASGMRRLRRFIYGYEDGPVTHVSHPDGTDGARSCAQTPSPPFVHYTDSRAQAFGEDNSTKLSAFVASGALSPRQIYWEVKAAQEVVPPEQIQWLILHQCIRWSQGMTGLPFVDACMRELATTGFMSNRGRQNVASLLAKDLNQDWRQGAEIFESLLVDCDVAVNYCNWNYFAGIGNDLRNRQFKTVTQGMQYDTDAQLIGAWIPELAGLPTQFQHQPFALTAEQALLYHFTPGVTYPAPMVDAQSQVGAGPKVKGPVPVLRERKAKKEKERKTQKQ